MDPLDGMCNALVSINNILQKRKKKIGDNYLETIPIETTNSKRERIGDSDISSNINNTNLQTSSKMVPLTTTTVTNENKNNQLHFESLTEDNFYHAHLCNRSIDELPSIIKRKTAHMFDYIFFLDVSAIDINQLKLINIYTIQDLLGRYLIHDTPEEFHAFLIKTFHCSEKTASVITHLLHQWTKYNLDGIRENEK